MSSNNRIKAALRPNNRVTLTMERRDAWGRVNEKFQFTVSRRVLERALADATIEAPWKELMHR